MFLFSFVSDFFFISVFFLSYFPNCNKAGFAGGQCDWRFATVILDTNDDGVGCDSLTDSRIMVSCTLGFDEDFFTGTPGVGFSWTNGPNSGGDGDPYRNDICPNIIDTTIPCSTTFDQYYYYPFNDECIDISGNSFRYHTWVSDFCFDSNLLGSSHILMSYGTGRSALWENGFGGVLEGFLHPNEISNTGPPLATNNNIFNPIEINMNDNTNIISLNPSDIDGDIITCRKSTSSESGIPNGVDFNDFWTVDVNSCQVTVDGSYFDNDGDIKMLQVMLETNNNGDKNPVDLLVVGRDVEDNSELVESCLDGLCSVKINSDCENTPCECNNPYSADYDVNCMVSQPNDVTICCSQCQSGYWQITHNSKCIPCDSSTVGDGCMFCQFKDGCGQCQQGYTRTYDETCQFWICV